MLDETLGKWHFWLFLIGFHLTFDFMHIPGILGMPRRIYTYEPGRGWESWNMLVSVGAMLQTVATVCFVVNLIWSYYRGKKAGNDPWDAWTLEWSVASPPPVITLLNPGSEEPAAVVGHQASGRPGLEIRMRPVL